MITENFGPCGRWFTRKLLGHDFDPDRNFRRMPQQIVQTRIFSEMDAQPININPKVFAYRPSLQGQWLAGLDHMLRRF